MGTERLKPVIRKPISVRRFIPTEFIEVESQVAIRHVIYMGKVIPTEFGKVKRYRPTDFTPIDVPILVPDKKI